MSYEKELTETFAKRVFNCIEYNLALGDIEEIVSADMGVREPLKRRFRIRTKSHGTHWYTVSIKEDM